MVITANPSLIIWDTHPKQYRFPTLNQSFCTVFKICEKGLQTKKRSAKLQLLQTSPNFSPLFFPASLLWTRGGRQSRGRFLRSAAPCNSERRRTPLEPLQLLGSDRTSRTSRGSEGAVKTASSGSKKPVTRSSHGRCSRG